LTLTPATVTDTDIRALRANGFDDVGIHDATQVISYFNYINRIADALDVSYEAFVRPWERTWRPEEPAT
jgi:alkylhydroperoxidase family enzyme